MSAPTTQHPTPNTQHPKPKTQNPILIRLPEAILLPSSPGASSKLSMRSRFSLGRRSPRAVADPKAKARRKKRALLAVGILLCAAAPTFVAQLRLYRRNLAMAREILPILPVLTARDRLLVLAPHPDDETLGAGGTIAEARRRGLAVRIVFLTNGDGSRSTQLAVNLRQRRLNSFSELAKLRQQEATSATRALGVATPDLIFLGYPDGGTKEMLLRHWTPNNLYRSPFTGADYAPYDNARTPNAPYCGEQALADVTSVLREFRPTIVITTHPRDSHSDHHAAYEFAAKSLEQLRKNPRQAWAEDTRLLTFIVHHGLWPVPYGYHPDATLSPPADLKSGTNWMRAPLNATSRSAKNAALEAYSSQLATTPNYLRSFLRRNELFGLMAPHEQK